MTAFFTVRTAFLLFLAREDFSILRTENFFSSLIISTDTLPPMRVRLFFLTYKNSKSSLTPWITCCLATHPRIRLLISKYMIQDRYGYPLFLISTLRTAEEASSVYMSMLFLISLGLPLILHLDELSSTIATEQCSETASRYSSDRHGLLSRYIRV